MEKVDSKQETYVVIDKSVNVLRGESLEVVTHVILQHSESGSRLSVTASRLFPEHTYFSTQQVEPVEMLIIGDEVTLKDGRVDQVILKRKNR